jgi:dTDP-glucose 4,6-dehydratase
MKTIFVAGGAGFLGSNFVRYLLDKYLDYQIINFDSLSYPGRLINVDSIKDQRYMFVHGDITKLNQVFDALPKSTDIIINFVDEKKHASFLTTNIFGTFILLEAAKKRKIQKFIQISTNDVYLNNVDPYIVSKISADMLVKSYSNKFQLPTILFRCSEIFGAYQFLDGIIPILITNALKNEKTKLLESESRIHDWLHILDFCRALDTILHYGKKDEVYNIGGWCLKQNFEVVGFIYEYLKVNKKLVEFSQETDVLEREKVDFSELTSKFKWKPYFDFESGLRDTIEWYTENHEWWEK